jgi:hypothetical protein
VVRSIDEECQNYLIPITQSICIILLIVFVTLVSANITTLLNIYAVPHCLDSGAAHFTRISLTTPFVWHMALEPAYATIVILTLSFTMLMRELTQKSCFFGNCPESCGANPMLLCVAYERLPVPSQKSIFSVYEFDYIQPAGMAKRPRIKTRLEMIH